MIGTKMKRKLLFCILIIFFLITVICTRDYLFWPRQNSNPFNDLRKPDIHYIYAIYSVYPDYKLSQNEQAVLESLLSDITIFDTDNSYTEYEGLHSLMFELKDEKGKVITISACYPFFIINSIGYRTSYEPSHKVSNFYWDIVDTKIRTAE